MGIKKTILVLGSGNVSKKNSDTLYLDIKKLEGVDIIRDIEKGLPFDDNKFKKIIAHHILEHINDLIFVMNEIHRILQKDGVLEIEVPFGSNALIDPTHKRILDINGFNFFIIKDFNSINTGFTGWFKMEKITALGPDNKEIRGLNFILKKVEY